MRIIGFTEFLSESQLLLEYDREKTMSQHADKAVKRALENTTDNHQTVRNVRISHDPSAHRGEDMDFMHSHAKDIMMDDFEHADPTSNKKYVQHIARIYGSGGINRHEDLDSRMNPALEHFDELVKRKKIPAEHRDIGRIKSLSQLEDLVDKHRDVQSEREKDAALHEKMKGQATITDHPTFTHIIPHTEEASKHFGKGTRWCTAAKNNNLFQYYNSNSKLHILTPKDPKHLGEKYQFHGWDEAQEGPADSVDNGQFMNEKDEDGYKQLHQNHPEIGEHIADYHSAQLDRAEREDPNSVLNNAKDSDEPWVKHKAISNAKKGSLTDETVEKLVSDPDFKTRYLSYKHLPASDPRPYNDMKAMAGETDEDYETFVSDHLRHFPHMTHPGMVDALLDHSSDDARFHASYSPAISQKRLDSMATHESASMRHGAAAHPKTKIENLNVLANDSDKMVREAAVKSLEKRADEVSKSQVTHHTNPTTNESLLSFKEFTQLI